jgi:16S rRNA (cytosine1402-N4)-methyltransferase
LENSYSHRSVLLNEIIDHLAWESPGLSILDLTVGAGGHLLAILERFPEPGSIVAVDQDLSALELAKKNLSKFSKIEWVHSNFSQFTTQTDRKFDRIVVDLGVSSMQLDDPTRGFSFRADGPLDMRMDTSRGISAAEWLMQCSEEELLQVLRDGEEPRARWFTQRWMEFRRSHRAQTTEAFVRCFGFELGSKNRLGKHPMTKVFQAIRMYINREMEVLEKLLERMPHILNTSGRAAVITFHSLEDRVVKWALRGRLAAVNKKVIIASEQELSENPRSRSAKLRIFEKMESGDSRHAIG